MDFLHNEHAGAPSSCRFIILLRDENRKTMGTADLPPLPFRILSRRGLVLEFYHLLLALEVVEEMLPGLIRPGTITFDDFEVGIN